MDKYEQSTVKNYTHWINRFIEYIGEEKIVEEITVDDFIGYAHALKTRYKLAKSSQAYHLISLRQFWSWMNLNEYTRLPYQLIPVPKYQTNSHPPATKAQTQQIIESIKGEGDGFIQLRDQTIVAMLYATGIRVSELCNLKRSDLQLAQRWTTIVSSKNHLNRTIVWDDETEVLLLKYLAYREEYAIGDDLFISMDRRGVGKGLTPRSVERMFQKHRKRLGFTKRIVPHSERHGYGRDSSQEGRHPVDIQKSLGHKNLNSQAVYEQLDDFKFRKEASKFVEKRKLAL